jgi:hypothetical protein
MEDKWKEINYLRKNITHKYIYIVQYVQIFGLNLLHILITIFYMNLTQKFIDL